MTPGEAGRTPTPSSLPLDVLSERLRAARATVQALRHEQARGAPVADARRCLRLALEAYVQELEVRRLPTPGALQRELQLHRHLLD